MTPERSTYLLELVDSLREAIMNAKSYVASMDREYRDQTDLELKIQAPKWRLTVPSLQHALDISEAVALVGEKLEMPSATYQGVAIGPVKEARGLFGDLSYCGKSIYVIEFPKTTCDDRS